MYINKKIKKILFDVNKLFEYVIINIIYIINILIIIGYNIDDTITIAKFLFFLIYKIYLSYYYIRSI